MEIELDPIPLTTEGWDATRASLALLGLLALSALVSGSSLMLAHAILPSAMGTKHISSSSLMRMVRIGAYAVGIAAFASVVALIVLFILSLGWINDIFPNYWQ